MQIIELKSENVKRLRAVRIKPDGNLVVIGGANAQGKSSVLDSIEYALAGGKSIPQVPVRRGQKTGSVDLALGDGGQIDLQVKRTFSAAGTTSLTVTGKDGARLTSPQAILDRLNSTLSFDPLTFFKAKEDEQAKTLKKLLGLDFTALDAEYTSAFAERTNINREAKSVEAQLAVTPAVEAPAEEESVAAILEEQRQASEHNQANVDKRARMSSAEMAHKASVEGKAACLREIDRLKTLLRQKELEAEHWDQEVMQREGKVAELQKESQSLKDIDLRPFQARASQVEDTNRKVRQNKRRSELVSQLKANTDKADKITRRLEDIETQKREAITSAKFPIQGVGFDDLGRVTLNGLPFSQASSAEQLRMSVAIGLALNPKLKILLIRDGSLLDDENLKLIASMASEAQAQVWLEKVGKTGDVSVIIEDGEVAEQPEPQPAGELKL